MVDKRGKFPRYALHFEPPVKIASIKVSGAVTSFDLTFVKSFGKSLEATKCGRRDRTDR